MARWHNCATVYVNNLTSIQDPGNRTVEVSFAIWPDPSKATGIGGELYYRMPPIVQQDSASEVAFQSIYSEGVVVKQMPEDGNVLYSFRLVNSKEENDA